MIAWPWLLAGAALAAFMAYATGWPVWSRYRDRQRRDINAERYLAWRGRADRRPQAGMSRSERTSLLIAAGEAAVAGALLILALTQL